MVGECDKGKFPAQHGLAILPAIESGLLSSPANYFSFTNLQNVLSIYCPSLSGPILTFIQSISYEHRDAGRNVAVLSAMITIAVVCVLAQRSRLLSSETQA